MPWTLPASDLEHSKIRATFLITMSVDQPIS